MRNKLFKSEKWNPDTLYVQCVTSSREICRFEFLDYILKHESLIRDSWYKCRFSIDTQKHCTFTMYLEPWVNRSHLENFVARELKNIDFFFLKLKQYELRKPVIWKYEIAQIDPTHCMCLYLWNRKSRTICYYGLPNQNAWLVLAR